VPALSLSLIDPDSGTHLADINERLALESPDGDAAVLGQLRE
jgi:hypothetical protein